MQVNLRRPHKDIELLRFDKVGTAGHLPNEHVQKEAPFVDKLKLGRAELLFWRQRWHVEARESLGEELSQDREVTVSAEYLKAAQPICSKHCILIVVAAFRPVRIADLKGLGLFHPCEASFYLKLAIDLAVLLPVLHKIIIQSCLPVGAAVLLIGISSCLSTLSLL